MASDDFTQEKLSLLYKPISDEDLKRLISHFEKTAQTAVYGGGAWQTALRTLAALNALALLRAGIRVEGTVR